MGSIQDAPEFQKLKHELEHQSERISRVEDSVPPGGNEAMVMKWLTEKLEGVHSAIRDQATTTNRAIQQESSAMQAVLWSHTKWIIGVVVTLALAAGGLLYELGGEVSALEQNVSRLSTNVEKLSTSVDKLSSKVAYIDGRTSQPNPPQD